jgi:hypothetical protein
MDDKEFNLLTDSARRLSDMANSVAGFAISSSLVLIFACLKDLSDWISSKPIWFCIGIALGNAVYVAAVWLLYRRETALLKLSGVSRTPGDVSHLLAWSRTAGIIFFAVISFLAVWGAGRGPGI